MKKSNFVFTNIFYIFFAFCFMSAGFFTLFKSQEIATSYADFVAGELVDQDDVANQDLSEYFFLVREEFYDLNSAKTSYSSGLISSYNTYLYNSYYGNYFTLSFATNGTGYSLDGLTVASDISNYLYYTDSTHFYYYNIAHIDLYINGVDQDISTSNFVDNSGLYFANGPTLTAQKFEMTFAGSASDTSTISIMDGNNVVEGVYTISIQMYLLESADGTDENITDRQINLIYSFYVLDNSNYFTSSQPNVTNSGFDSTISASTTTYLYSNYSSIGTANQIPYIEYDATRFEVQISKTLSNSTYTSTVTYDEENGIVSIGDDDDDIVYILQRSDNTVRIYFTDVGNYQVTLNAIKVVSSGDDTAKYDLDGLSSMSKNYLIYMYGYQMTYTDYDSDPDENNVRPTKELKSYDYKYGVFENSADITSGFLNSNSSYSQDSTSFTAGNILGYVNSLLESEDFEIVQTNQTPIKITSNATLSTGSNSINYIFSTNSSVGASYDSSNYGNIGKLYQTSFDGRTQSGAGIYIYIITYTFENYRSSATGNIDLTTTFYQVFLFEIVSSQPTISVQTEAGEDVYSNKYYNQSIVVTDTTQLDYYNKSVTVQIYAQDFDGNYLDTFNGEQGISLTNMLALGTNQYYQVDRENYSVTLLASAHYTIRLYYTNQLTSANVSINSTSGFETEQYFTIDKEEIEGVTGRNVQQVSGTNNYTIISEMETLATNQSMVISWTNKKSGASSYGYYRYFQLQDASYYTTSSNLSSLLGILISSDVLPVNSVLDMSGLNNNWLDTLTNTVDYDIGDQVSSQYVFFNAGLYIVDIYDQAGNHTMDVFFIDNTTPNFALYNGSTSSYELTSSTMYISETSTLHWTSYKGIYMINFDSDLYTTYSPTSIASTFDSYSDTYNFYTPGANCTNTTAMDIYTLIYEKLYTLNDVNDGTTARFMQYLSGGNLSSISPPSSSLISSYQGMYFTIKINQAFYYLGTDDEYHSSSGNYSYTLPVGDDEYTFTVLIRDVANTQYLLNYDTTYVGQYTNYYSARQTIIVSFDTSQFAITYQTSSGETEILSSNTTQVDESASRLTTYLTPSSMRTTFTISIIPTSSDDSGENQYQVESVSIDYYAYTATSYTAENVTYYYYTLSDSPSNTTYDLSETSSTTAVTYDINLSDGVTAAGKYVITRTYVTTSGGSGVSEKDYVTRTFVLYVDRNEVISAPSTYGDHQESIVGGDIFVAMFDNDISADIIVTFPNSAEGNSDNTFLYNNGTVTTVLTTNKVPVNVYIPQYKYTTYVHMNGTDFVVESEEGMNEYYSSQTIREYVLYAEIYKDGLSTSNLIGVTNSNVSSPTLSTAVVDENGFLVFYSSRNGGLLGSLTEAGEYYVIIYQGFYGTGTGDNSYVDSITFKFVIESATPDFNVTLVDNSTPNSIVYTSGSISQAYYTNQSQVVLSWNASTDKYTVEVDTITISGQSFSYTITKESSGDTVTWTADTNVNIWSSSPTLQNNNTYVATLNLSALSGVYVNGGYVDITMQFNQNSAVSGYYSSTTKRINIDLSAPSTNITNLVNLTSQNGLISLDASTLRTYLTASNNSTTDLSETSYNISNSTNQYFAYYSYTVTASYLATLQSSQDYVTYIRTFSSKYDSDLTERETSPNNFTADDFDTVNSLTSLATNQYYEVVETDRAGNMTIYTIYVVDYSASDDEDQASYQNLISYTTGDDEVKNYTITDYNNVVNSSSLYGVSGSIHNIYARTGFSLSNINFFGDEWAIIKLDTYNSNRVQSTRIYMLSPYWSGYALLYDTTTATFTTVSISSLIDGTTGSMYKNVMSIYNRQTGSFEAFYINIYNVSLSASLTDTQSEEYISFTNVTNSQIQDTEIAYTYVTSMKITANNETIYEQTNPLGYSSVWTNSDLITVTVPENLLYFTLNSNTSYTQNVKIVYEYTDNYGTTYQRIHLYQETVISDPITSTTGSLYSFYDEDLGRLYYITNGDFSYTYNTRKYSVVVRNLVNDQPSSSEQLTNATQNTTSLGNNLVTLTISPESTEEQYNNRYVLQIYDVDDETNLIEEIYFVLYDELPRANLTNATNTAGQFKIVDSTATNVTSQIINTIYDENTYYTQLQIFFNISEDNFIPVVFSISTDRITWRELVSGEKLTCQSDEMETYYLKIWYDEDYLINDSGNPAYVFGSVPATQIYQFNLASITSSYWVEQTDSNGVTSTVEKNGTIYTTTSGRQYTNHYIVNLDYSDRANVTIRTNQQQNITYTHSSTDTKNGITSEIYYIYSTTSSFETYIVITYIPSTSSIVSTFNVSNINGELDSTNLITYSSWSVVVPSSYTGLDRIMLQWSAYYGIEQNEISISITRVDSNGNIELIPQVYSSGDYKYTYLTYSGQYIITLTDSAGNVQVFSAGAGGETETFTLTFLKDVPFTVTYTNPLTGETETSLPIKQAVYNSEVTIKIERSSYYVTGQYPTITVLKNGSVYDGGFSDTATEFTFTEAGYYEIYFTATAYDQNSNQIELREEVYQFTIINSNEYRISYVYNMYSNYYIESVIKDDVDITSDLVKLLDVETITVNGITYLAQLPISYLDEKTGVGTYIITVNSNNSLYKDESFIGSFTFIVTINSGTAPLNISVSEGESTTSNITITFNAENLYAELGECTLQVVSYNSSGVASVYGESISITAESTGQMTKTISSEGTYYVQVVSPSGILLFSYKVIRTAPMNAASIIAIVIAVLVLIAVVFIIYKLRKRISVK